MARPGYVAGLWLVAAAQLADLVTFMAAAAILPSISEANPVVRDMWSLAGPMGVALFKLAGLVVFLAVLDYYRYSRPAFIVALVAIPVGLGLSGAAANLVTLAVALGR